MVSPPEELVAGAALLRRPQPADAESIFREYARDPEVTRYLSWRPHGSLSDTEAFLDFCRLRWESGEEWAWCIVQAADPESRAVGMIACRRAEHAASLGYVLARRLWNQGLATSALNAVVGWLESLDGIRRIWAVCDTENAASARVMEKAGLVCEGVLKRWIVHPNVSPEPRDCFVYAKVR